MPAPVSTSRTRWDRVYALAALQLVVTLGWMAYAHFNVMIADRFGFTALSGLLSVYLGIAGATLGPLVGGFGDRVARRGGSRFPILVTGGLLAGAAFVSVAVTISTQPSGPLSWALVGMILTWIAAMTVLQTPALSLLPSAAQAERWPVAASPLVVATVLPTAAWPLVSQALDGMGGTLVFFAGGVLVVSATFFLRRAFAESPSDSTDTRSARRDDAGIESFSAALPIVFLVGIASAFVTRLASDVVPTILARTGGGVPALFSATTLGAATIFAASIGPLGISLGSRRGVIGSAALAAVCAAVAPLSASLLGGAAIAIVLGASLAVHLDCALPFALGSLPLDRAGLSAGLYLGGVFAGSQLAQVVPFLSMR